MCPVQMLILLDDNTEGEVANQANDDDYQVQNNISPAETINDI